MTSQSQKVQALVKNTLFLFREKKSSFSCNFICISDDVQNTGRMSNTPSHLASNEASVFAKKDADSLDTLTKVGSLLH